MRKAREAFRGAFSTVLKHYYSLVLVLLTVRYKKAYKHTKRNLESLGVVYAEIGMLHLCSTLKSAVAICHYEPHNERTPRTRAGGARAVNRIYIYAGAWSDTDVYDGHAGETPGDVTP